MPSTDVVQQAPPPDCTPEACGSVPVVTGIRAAVSGSRVFRGVDDKAHRVRLSWAESYIQFLLTPRLAADAGITAGSQVCWGVETTTGLLALKVAPQWFRTPRPRVRKSGVVHIQYTHNKDDEREVLRRYFPEPRLPGHHSPLSLVCDALLVAAGDGAEIHVLAPGSVPVVAQPGSDGRGPQPDTPTPGQEQEGRYPVTPVAVGGAASNAESLSDGTHQHEADVAVCGPPRSTGDGE